MNAASPSSNPVPPRPVPLPVNPDGIPAELVQLDQWLGWTYEWNGKEWTKPPLSLRNFKAGSSKDSKTWTNSAARSPP
jgi:putative DNA primase/helicase